MVDSAKKEEIIRCYRDEPVESLAIRLNLSKYNVIKIANRAGVTKGPKTNRILDNNTKLCPCCRQYKDVSKCFYRDRYQANGVAYLCKECMSQRKLEPKENVEEKIKRTCKPKVSIQFGTRKTRNAIIQKDGIPHLKCKNCFKVLPLTSYAVARGNINGVQNVCKSCNSKKRKEALAKL